MKDFFDILKEFVPLWLTLISLGFGYLIYLYTKIFKQTNDLAEKQTQYLKDKIDTVDKTTGIFERTVTRQEGDISYLNETNERLKVLLEKERVEKEVELSKVQARLDEILNKEGVTFQYLSSGRRLTDSTNDVKDLIEDLTSKMLQQIKELVPSNTQNDSVIAKSRLTIAKAQMAKGNLDDAANSFEYYTSAENASWEVYFSQGVNLANIRKGQKSNRASVKAYNDAINVLPHGIENNIRARIFGYRGAILKRLHRLDEAEADLNIAIKYATGKYEIDDINYNLACVYAMHGDKVKMISTILKIKEKRIFHSIKHHFVDYFKQFETDKEFKSIISSKISV